MRAVQVVRLEGPSGVDVVDVPEPTASGGQVLVDVRAVGVSFPDLLLRVMRAAEAASAKLRKERAPSAMLFQQ